ncbi:MAG TPA: hypothetical protein VFR07_11305 [Mycobacteriales bacterium]|jgi:hypothetical protein|nr:hypothetical protein [Mycobacteriales bacterium]
MTDSYTTPDPALGADTPYGSTAATGGGTTTWDDGGSTTGTKDVAKEQAGQVASGAKQAGQQVAGEAKHQVGQVTQEAGNQARTLLTNAQGELKTQASGQQQRVAGGLKTLGQELSAMAAGEKPAPGPAADLINQASQRIDTVASWIESREPADLLQEVQMFARRRPGAFLAIAAGAGLLVGRFARGAKDLASDDSPSSSGGTSDASYGTSTSYGTSAPESYSTTTVSSPVTADPVEPGYPYAAPGTAPATPGYYAPGTTSGREGFSA